MNSGKPKQPPSSYLLFFNYERETVKKFLEKNTPNTTVKLIDIHKEIGIRWKNLPDEERSKYEEEAQMLKAKYNEELLEWQKSQTGITGSISTDTLVKIPTMKVQKIMHLNKNVRKINNEAINAFQRAIMLFLLELVNKTIDYKNDKNPSKFVTSFDIISCIKREGIKYKFLEDCLYLLKDDQVNMFYDEEDHEESIFDLCEEDKKVYDYDVQEKKMKEKTKTKESKPKGGKAKGKETGKAVYADITSYFKKV